MKTRLLTPLALAFAHPAWAAGPMSRLQGVSQHAKKQAESGPDHLWIGLGVGLVVVAALGAAALWTLRRGRG